MMVDPDRIRAYLGIASFWAPAVSPDGDAVAYRRSDTEGLSLHLTSLADGQTRQLCDDLPPGPRNPIYWLPDGDAVVCRTGGEQHHAVELIDRDGTGDTVVEHDGLVHPWRPTADAIWYWGETETGWTLYRHPHGADRTEFATFGPESVDHQGGGVSDGRVAFNRTRDGAVAPHVAAVPDGNERRLDLADWAVHAWASDDRLLLTKFDADGIGIYDPDDEAFVWTDETVDRPMAVIGDDVLAVRGWTLVVGGPGKWREVPHEGAAVPAPLAGDEVLVDDRRAVVPRKSDVRPRELLRIDVEAGTVDPLVTADFGPVDPASIVEPEAVEYPTPGGVSVGGYLWTPSGEGPYPAVVEGYPPKANATPGLTGHIQLFVDPGYAVLWAGHRGDELEAHSDFAAAARWLAERDDIREDAIAFYGHSAGGKAALGQAFRHPEVWSAVVAWAGAFDLEWEVTERGDPTVDTPTEPKPPYDEAPAVWGEASPATYADSLSVHLCAIYGRRDPLVPIGHGRRLVDTVPDDAPLEYHEFDTGHGGAIADDVAVWRTILEFLDRRLCGEIGCWGSRP
ncbi:MAG: prolyl oligopeptidase family serine peptidase [Halobacteriaceae archaeon]